MNLAGLDVDQIRRELERFVTEATPQNASSPGVFTTYSTPQCGRAKAIELSERVLPILARLYPEWRDENTTSKNFEFSRERDACQRLLGRIASHQEIDALFAAHDDAPNLSAGQMHGLIWRAASAQWGTAHRHEAVLAAAKAINSRLQEKLDRRDLSEAKLIREAFSDKPPEARKPRLRFAAIADDQTRESLRQGVMAFGAGCFQAIRNPVGHLPNEEHELSEQAALERLAALSLLARWIEEAEVERVPQPPDNGP